MAAGEWGTRVYGPEILISTQNAFTIENESGQILQVGQGQPVWIPFSDLSYTVTGDCLLFRCATKDYKNDVHEGFNPMGVPKVFRTLKEFDRFIDKNERL